MIKLKFGASKALIATGLLLATSMASAFPIISSETEDLSGNTQTSCVTPYDDGCELQAITPHSRWQPNDPNGLGAEWVSYADTGSPGTVTTPSTAQAAAMTVTEIFHLDVDSLVTLDVWADDTSSVSLDGVVLIQPNITQNICANGTIGCEPDENAHFEWDLLAGTHTLIFEVFQVGGGPLGLLYSGETSPSEVPEPATMLLFGLGLLGLGASRRKIK